MFKKRIVKEGNKYYPQFWFLGWNYYIHGGMFKGDVYRKVFPYEEEARWFLKRQNHEWCLRHDKLYRDAFNQEIIAV